MLYDPNWEEKQTHRKFLLDAIELLETKGWVQGATRSSQGFCIIGALMEVTDYKSVTNRWIGSIGETLAKRIASKIGWTDGGTPDGLVAIWNDTGTRTKSEVIDLLKEVVDAV